MIFRRQITIEGLSFAFFVYICWHSFKHKAPTFISSLCKILLFLFKRVYDSREKKEKQAGWHQVS